ncbi:phosphatidate cytidylyltransferase [Hyphobacterium sp.]|uniref:phosphatidate cytidylyltransferase n=1 Tax=Hyphobacterium sp. TaxID=2004662 RepID=UPI003BAC2B61
MPPDSGGVRQRDPALATRLLSAAILIPVSLFLLWNGGLPFTAYCAAFAAAMAWEWMRMADRDAPTRSYAIASAAASGAVLFAADGEFFWMLAWPLAGAAGVIFAGNLEIARRWRGAFGIVYVALAVSALASIRALNGFNAAVFILLIVWAADSAAYFAGTWLRGPKLWPSVSPNKTWTGLIAGLAGGSAAAWGFSQWQDLPVGGTILMGLILSLAAIGGDLAMSGFKRMFGVKDTGEIIPGHGGVLDRVDALMAACLMALGLSTLNVLQGPL